MAVPAILPSSKSLKKMIPAGAVLLARKLLGVPMFLQRAGRYALVFSCLIAASNVDVCVQAADPAAQKKETEKVPADADLQKLVEATLMAFNNAVEENDFETFYDSLSNRWKYRGKSLKVLGYTGTDPERVRESDRNNNDNRVTVTALKRAFEPFVTARIDLSPLRGKKFFFDERPSINADGVLTLLGHAEGRAVFRGKSWAPRGITFKLEYVFERSSWRLFGISVDVAQVE